VLAAAAHRWVFGQRLRADPLGSFHRQVVGDPVDPGIYPGRRPQASDLLPGNQKRLLGKLFRVFSRAQQSRGVSDQRPVMSWWAVPTLLPRASCAQESVVNGRLRQPGEHCGSGDVRRSKGLIYWPVERCCSHQALGRTMELQVTHEAGYVLAATSGPIDGSAGELFRAYLHPLVGQSGTRLVLDLSKSDRINSAGIGELVQLVTHANTNSSRVLLTACSPFVSIVLSRSGLDRFFDTADGLPEAIQRVLDG